MKQKKWRNIMETNNRDWTATERLIMGDILRHLKTEGYNGWISILKNVCEQAGLKPFPDVNIAD
jgi:hypothetical protein